MPKILDIKKSILKLGEIKYAFIKTLKDCIIKKTL